MEKMRSMLVTFVKTLSLLLNVSKRWFGGIIFTSVLNGVLAPLTLLISSVFLDSMITTFQTGQIQWSTFFWLACILLVGIGDVGLQELRKNILNNYTDKMNLEITYTILSKCSKLPLQMFEENTTYNKIKLATDEAPGRSLTIITTIQNLVSSIIQLSGTVAILWNLAWYLLPVCLLVSIPIFVINVKVSEFWYIISTNRLDGLRLSEAFRQIILKSENIKELKLHSASEFLKEKIIILQEQYNDENKKGRRKFSFMNLGGHGFQTFATFAIKVLVIVISLQWRHTLGAAQMYMNSVDTFRSSVVGLLSSLSSGYDSLLYLESYYSVIGISIPDNGDTIKLTNPISEIRFEHVYFRYSCSNRYVLEDISFTLQRNKTYALVGLNGVGKTTIIKLLLKLYTPSSGTIYINGQNICTIEQASLRSHMSVVFQDFVRYPLSIYENIGVGDLDNILNEQGITEAAKLACAEDFINDLPQKYITQMSKEWEDGTELSMGQWQKIAIARCFFRQSSDVLLLDEPFSSIDALSEREIINNLQKIKKEHICVFVTHRFSSISIADEVLFFNHKTITQAPHKVLMQRNCQYEEIILSQTEHFQTLSK